MKTLTDKNGVEIDQYRFESGSLFEFDVEDDAYLHVWKNANDDTFSKAVKSYEEFLSFSE